MKNITSHLLTILALIGLVIYGIFSPILEWIEDRKEARQSS